MKTNLKLEKNELKKSQRRYLNGHLYNNNIKDCPLYHIPNHVFIYLFTSAF